MLNNPSAIDDITDAEQIRVLFYASHRMVHAPLNKIIDMIKNEIQHDFLNALMEQQKATDERLEALQKMIDEVRLQGSSSTQPKK
ncbi:chaperonin cofactor prefoldin [Bartonella japonica]|uniref:Chaperonin cofactor prefoldin n=1 Tax=Bartonella japonica TaxID=357761 RepID=A0ABV2FQG0_9HYPH